MPEYRVIGKALRKVDAVAKVTGATKFADDLAFPRMLYCKLLRSTEPHARIISLETTAAASFDGVQAVLTGRDLPIPFGILPVSQDEHALCVDKVRFIGDPVAAVAATSEEAATAALDLIKVVYEPLQSIASAEEAVAHPEPRIHDYGDGGNLHKLVDLEFGDADAGIAEGDIVREDLFFFEGSTHLPMEQHAAVAMWSPDGKLTLWTSTQTPHYVHRAVAKVLELAPARVRVIATPNGGGFGGKSDPFNHEIAVAKLAMLTGRPVKITLTREEVFYCHRGRHPTLMWVKTGVKRDGSITGMHFRSLLDGGAYGSYGVASTYYTGALQTVTYHVPRYHFQGARAFTNKAPCGPKRGHGTPQPRLLWKYISTRSPSNSASIRRSFVSRRSCRRIPSRLTTCASARWASVRVSPKWSRDRTGSGSSGNCLKATESVSRARATSRAQGCRSTGTTCRTRACS